MISPLGEKQFALVKICLHSDKTVGQIKVDSFDRSDAAVSKFPSRKSDESFEKRQLDGLSIREQSANRSRQTAASFKQVSPPSGGNVKLIIQRGTPLEVLLPFPTELALVKSPFRLRRN